MTTVAERRKRKSRRLSLPFRHWSVLLATCLGMGHLPHSGRLHWGSFSVSLITPPLLWPLLVHYGPNGAYIACLVSCILGWVALQTIHHKGIPEDHDSSAVVLDEFAGAALAAGLAAPLVWHLIGAHTAPLQLISLLYIGTLFRVFDIMKPWPASVFDIHWEHPFSVMADDLAAGVWAALVAPLPFWLISLLH